MLGRVDRPREGRGPHPWMLSPLVGHLALSVRDGLRRRRRLRRRAVVRHRLRDRGDEGAFPAQADDAGRRRDRLRLRPLRRIVSPVSPSPRPGRWRWSAWSRSWPASSALDAEPSGRGSPGSMGAHRRSGRHRRASRREHARRAGGGPLPGADGMTLVLGRWVARARSTLIVLHPANCAIAWAARPLSGQAMLGRPQLT